MKSEKKPGKGKGAIRVFGAVALLAAGLATAAILMSEDLQHRDLTLYFSEMRVSSEVMRVLLVLLIVFPIALLWTGVVLLNRGKEVVEIEGVSSHAPQAAAPAASAVSADTPFATGTTLTAPTALRSERAVTAGGEGKSVVSESTVRFPVLAGIDARADKRVRPPYNDVITLAELCEYFRAYAASRLSLYYDISDVRKFIASLGVSPIVILQGMSGTGKTSLACAFGKFLHRDAAVVPVQPMWKERTDIIGYFNEFTGHFNETPFLAALYDAAYSEDVCLTVLDEMNIARVEYYFADFLSLLELPRPSDRLLTVTSETRPGDPRLLKNGHFCIPENMWYIGTANNDDSTFAISDKVYDRAMIINFDYKASPFRAEANDGVYLSYAHFRQLITEACATRRMSEEQRANLMVLDKYLIEHLHVTFGNRIMKQIEQYVPLYVVCGGSEEEALDDMISQKLFRKLEVLNPIYLRSELPGLLQILHDVFGESALPKCCDYIERLNEKF